MTHGMTRRIASQVHYEQGVTLTSKMNPKRSIQEEPWILTEALNEVEEMKRLFELYDFRWMARAPDSFSAGMVSEFYANYLATPEHQTLAG
ncbi:hypothetical protein HAX54_022735 [Datura stramonium]|uniref:Uncharacterized protein n=1 Tax=Datura stramonium TaxID=4076 RepID=A0ABS8UUZ0_DATST|nr:hypothetical protein [Datura stramonium]